MILAHTKNKALARCLEALADVISCELRKIAGRFHHDPDVHDMRQAKLVIESTGRALGEAERMLSELSMPHAPVRTMEYHQSRGVLPGGPVVCGIPPSGPAGRPPKVHPPKRMLTAPPIKPFQPSRLLNRPLITSENVRSDPSWAARCASTGNGSMTPWGCAQQ